MGEMFSIRVTVNGRKKVMLMVKYLDAACRAAHRVMDEMPNATKAEVVRGDGVVMYEEVRR